MAHISCLSLAVHPPSFSVGLKEVWRGRMGAKTVFKVQLITQAAALTRLMNSNSWGLRTPHAQLHTCHTSCPSRLTEGNVQNMQQYDVTAKHKKCTSKSESVCDVSSDSRRSPVLSPNHSTSLVSTVSSRRATGLQI